MGRYSSVQAYTDNAHNNRTTSYEQERATPSSSSGTGGTGTGTGALKIDKVHNPYGSTAGAGSGEFHVYRHARAREQERLSKLNEEEADQLEQQQYDEKINNWKQEEERNLNKKRKKRARNKASKLRKKNLSLVGITGMAAEEEKEHAVDDDEFEYTPLHKGQNTSNGDGNGPNTKSSSDIGTTSCNGNTSPKEGKDEVTSSGNACDDGNNPSTASSEPKPEPEPELPFKNDGSFLEMMKKMQAQAQAKAN